MVRKLKISFVPGMSVILTTVRSIQSLWLFLLMCAGGRQGDQKGSIKPVRPSPWLSSLSHLLDNLLYWRSPGDGGVCVVCVAGCIAWSARPSRARRSCDRARYGSGSNGVRSGKLADQIQYVVGRRKDLALGISSTVLVDVVRMVAIVGHDRAGH